MQWFSNPLTSPAGAQVARLLERNRIPGMTAGRVVVADYEKEYKGQFLIGQMGTNLDAWGAAMAQAAIDDGHRKIAMIWNQRMSSQLNIFGQGSESD